MSPPPSTLEEQIKAIEEEIQRTPYNKASQHHLGKLKAKLAKLRDSLEKRKSGKRVGFGFSIRKEGDATVVLVGFPSVGKSTLLNKLTNAESKVASYDFTTLEVIPGLMNYQGAKIQILDIPGLISGASFGKGRGREVLSVARNSDLILILLERNLEKLDVIEKELYNSGIRLNEEKPKVKIKKTFRGGINLFSSVKDPGISSEEIRAVLNENGIFNADVTIREKINLEKFLDVVIGNRVYLPSIVVLNKIDLLSDEELKKIESTKDNNIILISAEEGTNLEALREDIFKKLKFIKIFLKPPGKPVDKEKPLILKKDATVEDLCNKLHKDFKKKFRYARISGSSVKFKEEKVGLKHKLMDNDVVTIVKYL